MQGEPKYTDLRQQTNRKDLWLYRKSEVLYQLTFAFTRRFFPAGGMRSSAYWSSLASLASMASISTRPSRAIISPLSQSIRSVFGIPERA